MGSIDPNPFSGRLQQGAGLSVRRADWSKRSVVSDFFLSLIGYTHHTHADAPSAEHASALGMVLRSKSIDSTMMRERNKVLVLFVSLNGSLAAQIANNCQPACHR